MGSFAMDSFAMRALLFDFDIVIELHNAHLLDFVVAAFDELVAEAVRANDAAAVEDDTVSEHTTLADGGIRMQHAVLTDLCAMPHKGTGMDDGAIADAHIVLDDSTRTDADLLRVKNSPWRNRCRGIHAIARLPWRGTEMPDHTRKGQRGVFNANEGERVRNLCQRTEIRADEHRGSLGGLERRQIAGVSKEGNLTSLRLANGIEAGDDQRRLTAGNLTADEVAEMLEGGAHESDWEKSGSLKSARHAAGYAGVPRKRRP